MKIMRGEAFDEVQKRRRRDFVAKGKAGASSTPQWNTLSRNHVSKGNTPLSSSESAEKIKNGVSKHGT